jgi:chlorite dismutase
MSANTPPLIAFSMGSTGDWRVESATAVRGEGLQAAERLAIAAGRDAVSPPGALWTLRGVVGHTRYTTADEAARLAAAQPALGRPEATCAAFVPIAKSAAWWALAQDQRRAIYEERSKHTSIGLEYLPRIARRLHHSRELGEPFDFLTWFEFAPQHAPAFDDLLARLRASEEWTYVEREVEIRLARA